jgi:hypothetical protein
MAWRHFQVSLAAFAFLTLLLDVSCAHAACLPEKPDVSIFGIELGDPLSTVLQLGSDYELVEDDDNLPYAVFTNATETEVMKLFRHYGDTTNSFQEAEVLATESLDRDEDAIVLDTPRFRTGRGVKLGLTRKEVLDRFGDCAAVASNAGSPDVVRYELADIATSDLLKAHNMPLYYAEYAFSEDKLVRFAFGFSYP